MKFGRAKAARKTLAFFARTVGLKVPYHVILDGNFVVAFEKCKLPLKDRLDTTLMKTPMILHVTQSTIQELETLFEKTKNQIVKQALNWVRKHCQVLDSAEADESTITTTPAQDILKHLQGDKPFILCSQDETLLDQARQLGTCPILRLVRNSVLILEQPSKMASNQENRRERTKWTVAGSITEQDKNLVELVKEQTKRNSAPEQQQPQRHKRKAKGPNPLSCKKKKTSSS